MPVGFFVYRMIAQNRKKAECNRAVCSIELDTLQMLLPMLQSKLRVMLKLPTAIEADTKSDKRYKSRIESREHCKFSTPGAVGQMLQQLVFNTVSA